MILSIVYLLFYAGSGIVIGRRLFSTESLPRRLWLGLVLLGLIALVPAGAAVYSGRRKKK
jgi:hypothetical protein